ncbi:MAG: F-box protein [Nitrososphaerota archaeon]
MLIIVPLDTVRSVFEFLDLESLFKCRRLCKYMKSIIDHDFILLDYRKKLIILELFCNALPEELKNIREFTGKDLDFLPSKFTFETEDVDSLFKFGKLEDGEHLWVPSENKHIIMLQSVRFGNNIVRRSALVIDDSGFKIVTHLNVPTWIQKVTKERYVKKLIYKEECLSLERIENIASRLCDDSNENLTEAAGSVQYAFFCKTGLYMSTSKFQEILNNENKSSQGIPQCNMES